jgi:hypothetical protein
MKLNEYQARLLNRVAEELPLGFFETVELVKTLKRLSRKLHRIAEKSKKRGTTKETL